MTVGQLARASKRDIYVYRPETDSIIGRRPPERFVLAGYVGGAGNDPLMDAKVRGVIRPTPFKTEPEYFMVWV